MSDWKEFPQPTPLDYEPIAERYIRPAAKALREKGVQYLMGMGMTREDAEIEFSRAISEIIIGPGEPRFILRDK